MSRDRSVILADLKDARAELHAAQSTLALLLVDDTVDDCSVCRVTGGPHGVPRSGIAIARQIIERDLATRRVEAWTSLLGRLRAEARALGLFDQ